MDQFASRNIKVLGISKDTVESHQAFIEKHNLKDLTLLSDTKRRVIRAYDADHWLLPVASRVYLVVDKHRNIIFRENTGLFLLEDQTRTLISAIDQFIK